MHAAAPFLRLWFSLVAPERTRLVVSKRAERLRPFDERAPHLEAATWEELCRAAVPGLTDSLGGPFGPAGRYWSGSAPEWDVVASSTAGRTHLLGEVKWTAASMTAGELMAIWSRLAAKERPPMVDDGVVYALFVPVLPRMRPRALPDSVRMIDARAVVEALG